MKREQMQKEIDERRAAEAKALADAEQAKKEAQKNAHLEFKGKIKELLELCKTKLAGSKYDKFWVESIMKRFNTSEKVAPIIEYL